MYAKLRTETDMRAAEGRGLGDGEQGVEGEGVELAEIELGEAGVVEVGEEGGCSDSVHALKILGGGGGSRVGVG